MNTFTDALAAEFNIGETFDNTAFTDNGRIQHTDSGNPVLDLFGMIGSVRAGMDKKTKNLPDLRPEFHRAFAYDPELTIRVLLWARDVRGGAGEREIVRFLLKDLEKREPNLVCALLPKLVELGRWDDILVFENFMTQRRAFAMLKAAIDDGNGLAAKWAPRENSRQHKGVAKKIRESWGMSPRQYRKFLTSHTQVVEQTMSAQKHKEIEYEKVPSLASIRYRKAFERNDPLGYSVFNQKVASGEEKVNAGAVYPHQIAYNVLKQGGNATIESMWESLPDYLDGKSIFPLVDVSGSMTSFPKAGAENPIHVAIGLGLYLSMKTKGDLKDYFMTFTGTPEIVKTEGSLSNRLHTLKTSHWGYNTDVSAAFDLLLNTARKHEVSRDDMPEMLVILSDMEFDAANGNGGWADEKEHKEFIVDEVKKKYEAAGYKMPVLLMWNLTPTKRSHIKHDDRGFISVSGFSPSIMKAVLKADFDSITPVALMLEAINDPRYNWI